MIEATAMVLAVSVPNGRKTLGNPNGCDCNNIRSDFRVTAWQRIRVRMCSLRSTRVLAFGEPDTNCKFRNHPTAGHFIERRDFEQRTVR